MYSDHNHNNDSVLDDDEDDAVSQRLNPNPNLNLNLNDMNINYNNNDDEDDDIDVDDDDVDVDVDVDADADEDSTSSTDPPPLVLHHHHHPDPSLPPPPLPSAAPGQVTIALPTPDKRLSEVAIATAVVDEKKPYPIDESRKLFQRLWTDEDEMELLQGFLDYTAQRGANNSSHHHHDTTAFYDQIKSKLQLEFNKNQLVEKLRRLKKKYRNVMQKMSSGKDYVFKSPHDQATFEVSRKIWSGIGNAAASPAVRTPVAAGGGGVSHTAVDDGAFEDEEPSPNPNPNFMSAIIDYSYNPNGVDDRKTPIRSRKRPRPYSTGGGSGVGGGGINTTTPQINQHQYQPPPVAVGIATPATATNVIEETVKSCLSPIFKELLQSVMNLNNNPRGPAGLAFSPMPLGSGMGLGFGGGGGIGNVDITDERWKKQQILELEVFSRRLELVQDQIKAQLEELKGK